MLSIRDAFYLRPGRVPIADAGNEYVQFGPSEQLNEIREAIVKNFEAMQSA